MAGLKHDFLLIENGSFSVDKYDTYFNADSVEIHNDVLSCFADSISLLDCHNPVQDKACNGLCWFGPTLISVTSSEQLHTAINKWLVALSNEPDVLAKKGGWVWLDKQRGKTPISETPSFCLNELKLELSKLQRLCELVRQGNGRMCLLHLGV